MEGRRQSWGWSDVGICGRGGGRCDKRWHHPMENGCESPATPALSPQLPTSPPLFRQFGSTQPHWSPRDGKGEIISCIRSESLFIRSLDEEGGVWTGASVPSLFIASFFWTDDWPRVWGGRGLGIWAPEDGREHGAWN